MLIDVLGSQAASSLPRPLALTQQAAQSAPAEAAANTAGGQLNSEAPSMEPQPAAAQIPAASEPLAGTLMHGSSEDVSVVLTSAGVSLSAGTAGHSAVEPPQVPSLLDSRQAAVQGEPISHMASLPTLLEGSSPARGGSSPRGATKVLPPL